MVMALLKLLCTAHPSTYDLFTFPSIWKWIGYLVGKEKWKFGGSKKSMVVSIARWFQKFGGSKKSVGPKHFKSCSQLSQKVITRAQILIINHSWFRWGHGLKSLCLNYVNLTFIYFFVISSSKKRKHLTFNNSTFRVWKLVQRAWPQCDRSVLQQVVGA